MPISVSFDCFLEFWQDPPGTWHNKPIIFSGDRTFTYQANLWTFPLRGEWGDMIAVPVVSGSVDQAWRVAHGEDVDGDDPNMNDRRLALLIHPLTADDLLGDPRAEWSTFFSITPESNLGVVKPAGIARPANWVGSGGLAPDAGNNDLWHVAAASSAPKATLTLSELYTERMERCFDHAADLPPPNGGYKWHSELIFIYNRANPPQATKDLFDPPASQKDESIYHWKNRGAGRLDITAPRAGTVVLTVNYKEPVFDFPYTTNAEYNWGPESPSSLSWTEGTVVWNIEVVEGANQVVFDLALPKTGNLDPQMHVVTQVDIGLPPAEDAEDWLFSEITLLPRDPNALAQQEGETLHHVWSMYDPYQWASDFTGFRGILSGRRILAIPYGMEDRETVERSLKIRQKSVGYPSGLVFDYAKACSTTSGEVGYQEGLLSAYADPENGSQNKDADDGYLVALFRTFDLRHAHEWGSDGGRSLTGSPKVGTMALGASHEYTIYYDKYAHGRYHGLAFKTDRTDRKRREGTLYLWKRPLTGGAWQLTASNAIPDRFGRFRLGPDKEKDWYYGVNDSATSPPTSGSEFRNREYVWRVLTIPVGKDCACFHQLPNFLYVFYTEGGIKHIYNAPPDWYFRNQPRYQSHYPLPRQDTSEDDSSPSGYVDTNGRIRLYFIRGGALVRGTFPNWGISWEAGDPVATPITDADQAFAFPSRDRTRQHLIYLSGGSLVYAYSHSHFQDVDGGSTIRTGVDNSQISAYEGMDGFVYVYGSVGGALTCWRMTALNAWEEVGAV